jgi:hypothetical protein
MRVLLLASVTLLTLGAPAPRAQVIPAPETKQALSHHPSIFDVSPGKNRLFEGILQPVPGTHAAVNETQPVPSVQPPKVVCGMLVFRAEASIASGFIIGPPDDGAEFAVRRIPPRVCHE